MVLLEFSLNGLFWRRRLNKATVFQLYTEHHGKVSDKWSLYLTEYDRLFKDYHDKPVSLLEIGIQNGGSLEIWSKYFINAQKLVGCDINPACASLSYEDGRISIVVGDANSDSSESEILGYSPTFDLIIDDGSHHSGDIVKTFMRYFPHLQDEGIFVIEDLHCSYWQEYGGGLSYPFSSISFFKYLIDIVNQEHWGIEKTSINILDSFFSEYGYKIDDEFLTHIHSVEFINSMCVIKKSKQKHNILGTQFIAGLTETIVPGHLVLHSKYGVTPDQSGNNWTKHEFFKIKELAESEERIATLIQSMAERDEQIENLTQSIGERDGQIENLTQSIVERDGQIKNLSQTITSYQNSRSWRITKPLRVISEYLKKITMT